MTRKRLFGGPALIVLFVVSAVAIAGGEGPKIKQVQASIVYTSAEGETRFCEGPGGETFAEQRVRAFGTAEGSPALSGDVEVSLKLLNEESTGESFQEGRLVIHDPNTGRKKVVARFTDAGVAEIFQGTLVGKVKRGSKLLIANWRTTFHPNGAIPADRRRGRRRTPARDRRARTLQGPVRELRDRTPVARGGSRRKAGSRTTRRLAESLTESTEERSR
jgi:hypothetical protein